MADLPTPLSAEDLSDGKTLHNKRSPTKVL